MSPRVLGAAYKGNLAHQSRSADFWPGAVAPAEVEAFENHAFVSAPERARTRRLEILEQQAAQRVVGAVENGLEINSDRRDADTGEDIYNTDKT